jgi:hypothetical protein
MIQLKTSLVESFKEGYGSKRVLLPMMMMMMMMMMVFFCTCPGITI